MLCLQILDFESNHRHEKENGDLSLSFERPLAILCTVSWQNINEEV